MPFAEHRPTRSQPAWKHRLYSIIFESDTRAGRAFDIGLLIAIGVSITVVMLESVEFIWTAHAVLLRSLEWACTILFTLEYAARLACVRRPLRYVWSFYGVIDLFAFLPSYINLFIPTANFLLMVRVLRLLRIFRILKLSEFMEESETLMAALYSSRRKIAVFISTVLAVVLIMGTIMYLVEGPENGFESIPRGVYWSIVTITTVGYGDVTPHTVLGRTLACFLMIMGYGIIAVPTGIFAVELREAAKAKEGPACSACGTVETDREARFCRRCGRALG
ncbi:MAG TPA: ion transporter [Chthoniobacterales bacterium]|nr:ion transporter [Chthoniobacterales bacterium]